MDNQCIDCDLCRETAPDNYKRNDDGGYSYVHKQPLEPRGRGPLHKEAKERLSCGSHRRQRRVSPRQNFTTEPRRDCSVGFLFVVCQGKSADELALRDGIGKYSGHRIAPLIFGSANGKCAWVLFALAVVTGLRCFSGWETSRCSSRMKKAENAEVAREDEGVGRVLAFTQLQWHRLPQG